MHGVIMGVALIPRESYDYGYEDTNGLFLFDFNKYDGCTIIIIETVFMILASFYCF